MINLHKRLALEAATIRKEKSIDESRDEFISFLEEKRYIFQPVLEYLKRARKDGETTYLDSLITGFRKIFMSERKTKFEWYDGNHPIKMTDFPEGVYATLNLRKPYHYGSFYTTSRDESNFILYYPSKINPAIIIDHHNIPRTYTITTPPYVTQIHFHNVQAGSSLADEEITNVTKEIITTDKNTGAITRHSYYPVTLNEKSEAPKQATYTLMLPNGKQYKFHPIKLYNTNPVNSKNVTCSFTSSNGLDISIYPFQTTPTLAIIANKKFTITRKTKGGGTETFTNITITDLENIGLSENVFYTTETADKEQKTSLINELSACTFEAFCTTTFSHKKHSAGVGE